MKLDELKTLIRKTFRGVTLGDGVGLRQGRAMDDHRSEAEQKELREKDEAEDWTAIAEHTLIEFEDAQVFLDPKGIRFHLPAFLLLELNQRSNQSAVVRLLTQCDKASPIDFELLNSDQRSAVREFLVYIQAHPEYEWERPEIDQALKGFWAPQN